MNRDISTREAMQALKNNPGIKLVDVRTANEHMRGHIADSTNIPLSYIKSIINKIPDKKTCIFVYCKSGGRAYEAKKILMAMGYTDVTNIGGIEGWRLSGN